MKLKRYLWFIVSLLFFGGCESLEDTYSDYAGEGTIRYLGKCNDLSVKPGWQRLIVTWTNHVDPAIDKVKVSWTLDGITRDSLLEKGTTECNIRNLENATYEVAVCSVDKDGNCSLPALTSERPYTLDHESIKSFTRMFDKYFFVGKHLAIVFSEWQGDVETASLNYYSGGERKILELDSVFVTDNKYCLVPDEIDAGTKVTINRSGRLTGCSDLIVFNPYELTRDNRTYTPDFKQWLREKYGQSEITEAFVNARTELEIDYDINSFEDILNFPNLKTLVLGKNRYLSEDNLGKNKNASKVSDLEISTFALDVACKVNGLKVERYNEHYFPIGEHSFIHDLPNPKLPEDLSFLSSQNWTYSCSNEEYEYGIDFIFDESSTRGWQPSIHSKLYTYEMVVDMQETQTVNGVLVTQKLSVPSSAYEKCIAKKIQIKVSVDNKTWKDATRVIENTLGNTVGESTMIILPVPLHVRYLKFVVRDQAYNKTFYTISLGKIKVF